MFGDSSVHGLRVAMSIQRASKMLIIMDFQRHEGFCEDVRSALDQSDVMLYIPP